MTVEMHVPVIFTDGGPWAEHDVACPVCSERKAILVLNTGVFGPCDRCSGAGWSTFCRPWWVPKKWWNNQWQRT